MVGKRASHWPAVLLILAVCVLSRLPQLLSRNLMVDGDEAIVGLMGRHLLVDHELPIFFWGQRYGLSTVESGFAAAAFTIAGVGPIALKVSMLALWTIGVACLSLAFANLVGERRAIWLAMIFTLLPMWAVWSMKARGGYLTAFVAFAMLLWLMTRPIGRQGFSTWCAAGLLTAIIYLAQPLWLPGLAPITAVALARRRSFTCSAAYAGVVAAVPLIVRTTTDASAGPVFGNFDILGSVPLLGRQIYQAMTGWFDMSWQPASPRGVFSAASGYVWCGALVMFAGLQAYRLSSRRFTLWSHVLFASIAITLAGELVLLHARDARYLLPLGALIVGLGGVEVSDLLDRGVLTRSTAQAAAVALLALGAASMRDFKDFSFLWVNPPGSLSETERMRRLLTYLHVEGVSYVFCMNGLLDTQLAFYSNEQIIPRWRYLSDRHPPYVEKTDAALAAGKRVAVVGFTNESGAPGCWDVPICTGGIETLVTNPEQIYTVDGKYFAYVDANRPLLENLKFNFPE